MSMFNRRKLSRVCTVLGLILSGPLAIFAQVATDASATQSLPRLFSARFQPYVDNGTMAGSVCLVATKDKILDIEAVGYANIETKKPMSSDDEFWIASMTKPFTAVALMMLVDEGKVRLDDPVEKFIPEFKGQMVKQEESDAVVAANHPIEIRELLSHTSGLWSPADDLTLPLAHWVDGYAHSSLEHQPGTYYQYSNAGINTIGRIIEVVSGMPYEKFMQNRIFTPLGMTNTTFWPDTSQMARMAVAYHEALDNSGLQPAKVRFAPDRDGSRVNAMPAGGLFSNAPDLLKFCRMMLQKGTFEGKRYLSESAVETMTRYQTTPFTTGTYGLGWMISPTSFYHDGSAKTRMAIVPSEGLVEIFLTQIVDPNPPGANDFLNVFTKTAEDAFGKPAKRASQK